jgi:hypothetical protein
LLGITQQKGIRNDGGSRQWREDHRCQPGFVEMTAQLVSGICSSMHPSNRATTSSPLVRFVAARICPVCPGTILRGAWIERGFPRQIIRLGAVLQSLGSPIRRRQSLEPVKPCKLAALLMV